MAVATLTLTPAVVNRVYPEIRFAIRQRLLQAIPEVTPVLRHLIAQYADCSRELSQLPLQVIAANGDPNNLSDDSRMLLEAYRNRVCAIDLRGLSLTIDYEYQLPGAPPRAIQQSSAGSPNSLLDHARWRLSHLSRVFYAVHTLYRPAEMLASLNDRGVYRFFNQTRIAEYSVQRPIEVPRYDRGEIRRVECVVHIDARGNQVISVASVVQKPQATQSATAQAETPAPPAPPVSESAAAPAETALVAAVAGLTIEE